MEFCLPLSRLIRIRSLIGMFLSKCKVLLKDVQSLLGLFSFVAKIIPIARIFSHRLAMATKGLKNPYAHISIAKAIKEDLKVWDEFLIGFNGSMVWQKDFVKDYDLGPFIDASGAISFGAYLAGHWCASKWHPSWKTTDITRNLVLLELFPVVVSIMNWSKIFMNRRAIIHTDNKGILFAINCLSSKSEFVVKLLHFLVLHCMRFNIWFKAKHIPGVTNSIADSLSRLQFSRFRELAPEADLLGSQCPAYLWGLIWD